MPLIKNITRAIKKDVKASEQIRLPWWGVLCVIAGSALVTLLFNSLGRLNLAVPALNSVVVLCFAIAVKWKLRRCAWFWITMVILAALHVPLLLFVPWSTKWIPAPAIVVIDLADFIVVVAVLDAVARFMKRADLQAQ